MTAHNEAKIDEICKTVLMPGDPLRAKYIAETFLDNARLVNQVRGMLAYTGSYKGKNITVMASGMGMPSIGIYSYELFKFYNVEQIIRIGSAGSYVEELNVRDLVLVDNAYSNSSYAYVQNGYLLDYIESDKKLDENIELTAKDLNIKLKKANIYSSDVFYHDKEEPFIKKNNLKAVEMESFALFHNAKALGKKAACLLTISDSFVTKEEMSSEERQNSLNEMITLALETAIKL